MTAANVAAIVLAAGLGTRMASGRPKVLQPLAGRPMIRQLIESLVELEVARIVVVVGPGMEAVAAAVAPHPTVVQAEPLGTGHAAMAAKPAIGDFTGDILLLFGDSPLIGAATLRRVLQARRLPPYPAVVALGFRAADPGAYGRLIVGADGALKAIVEAGDAAPRQLEGNLCNSGAMAVDGARLFELLAGIGADNAKGEYYLTAIVAAARRQGLACAVVEGDAQELIGVNSRAELAAAEALVQERLRARALAGGATLIAPATVHLSFDTRLARDVVVHPYVVFGPGVRVGEGAEVRSFSHLEGAIVAAGARVGPFARLRPGATIGESASVGNFVEVKNAAIEAGAKANHLAYIGDARVGANANIGAGTITCNYDGFAKHLTEIGAGAFIGSNTALVAPVTVGAGAVVGAGSVIAKDVAADSLALTRAAHREIKGWAKRMRGLKAAKPAARTPAAKSKKTRKG